jgi:hypothetical protein
MLGREKKQKNRVRLFVEAGSEDGQYDREFGSLSAAFRAFDGLDEDAKPSAWIIEYREQAAFGGIPVVRNVVHMRHGQRVDEAEE